MFAAAKDGGVPRFAIVRCAAATSFGLHNDKVVRHRDERLDVVPHELCEVGCAFCFTSGGLLNITPERQFIPPLLLQGAHQVCEMKPRSKSYTFHTN